MSDQRTRWDYQTDPAKGPVSRASIRLVNTPPWAEGGETCFQMFDEFGNPMGRSSEHYGHLADRMNIMGMERVELFEMRAKENAE